MNDSVLSFSDSEWEMFDISYARQLREQYPELWAFAGGEKSDYINSLLEEIYDNGGYAMTPEQVEALELRESWIKRHKNDRSPNAVIAQVKWLAVSSHGQSEMKRIVNSEVEKLHARRNSGIQQKGAKQPLRDPKGGLTAAGRKHFKRTEGANLKPGVRGRADTPEKMRRKGSFLTRFFTNPSGPMKDEKGRPTRLALSAAAWGEPVPQNTSDAAELAAKGRRLLDRYERAKERSKK